MIEVTIMRTILITGGTGMIGKQLTTLLIQKGYDVIILSRGNVHDQNVSPHISYARWDVDNAYIDTDALAKADHIIHLAGAGVADKRWSKKRKQEILDSRVNSSALLVKALAENKNQLKSLISSSAIGWYGADTAKSRQQGFSEEAKAATAFLGETCRLWEEHIDPVVKQGIRLVKLRTGIVLSNEGGAFVAFKKPLKAGIASILGSGDQIISWIHVEDLCQLYLYAIEHPEMQGVYNAVAPHPVTNQCLTLALAKQMCGQFYIPVYIPAFIVKIMLGEMSIEVLKSANVDAHKILLTGFNFSYPTIQLAIAALLKNKSQKK